MVSIQHISVMMTMTIIKQMKWLKRIQRGFFFSTLNFYNYLKVNHGFCSLNIIGFGLTLYFRAILCLSVSLKDTVAFLI